MVAPAGAAENVAEPPPPVVVAPAPRVVYAPAPPVIVRPVPRHGVYGKPHWQRTHWAHRGW